MNKNNNPENFEVAMQNLEKIVAEIENNEIGLEDALLKYQNGVKLVKYCQDKLKEVEQKIKILDPDTNELQDFVINEV
jgi:exodeoxyribonuclease VII small subunit